MSTTAEPQAAPSAEEAAPPGKEAAGPPLPPQPIRPRAQAQQAIAEACGVNVGACYGCYKCSNGCPLTFAMDLMPYQVVRLAQLGQLQALEGCRTIWLCASCHTCVTRCPNGVDLPRLMDHLKEVVAREGRPVPEERTRLFHRLFLEEVLARGRVFEGSLLARYLLKTGGLFGAEARDNARLGWEMFKRGRIKLVPSRTRQRDWLKTLKKEA